MDTNRCSFFGPVPMTPVRMALFAIELVLDASAMFTNLMFAFLVWKTKLFHRNPKVLIYNLVIATIGTTLPRFFIVINKMAMMHFISAPVHYFIDSIHNASIDMNMFNQVALAVECVILTFCAAFESNGISLPLTLASVMFPYICTGLTILGDRTETWSHTQRFVLFQTLNVGSAIMILWTVVRNRRNYKRSSAGHVANKLHISINIRSFKVLAILAILTAVQHFVIAAIMLFIDLYQAPRCLYYDSEMSAHAFDLTVGVYCVIFPFAAIYVHDELRNHFRAYILRRPPPLTEAGRVVPRNAIGEDIVHTGNYANSSDHFRHLENHWRRRETVF